MEIIQPDKTAHSKTSTPTWTHETVSGRRQMFNVDASGFSILAPMSASLVTCVVSHYDFRRQKNSIFELCDEKAGEAYL